VIVALGRLPPRDATAVEALAERGRDKEVQKKCLARLSGEHPRLAEAIARAVAVINGVAGKPRDLPGSGRAARGAGLQARVLARRGGPRSTTAASFHINELAALRAENEACVRGHPPFRARSCRPTA
jgi:hypothetical protein